MMKTLPLFMQVVPGCGSLCLVLAGISSFITVLMIMLEESEGKSTTKETRAGFEHL